MASESPYVLQLKEDADLVRKALMMHIEALAEQQQAVAIQQALLDAAIHRLASAMSEKL